MCGKTLLYGVEVAVIRAEIDNAVRAYRGGAVDIASGQVFPLEGSIRFKGVYVVVKRPT